MAYQNTKKSYYKSGFKITKETNEQTEERHGLTALYFGDLMDKKELPWQKSFDPQKDKKYVLPYDIVTGKAFGGYSLVELCVAEKIKGRELSSQYISWNDIAKNNYRIKKGSQGISTEYAMKKDISYPVDPETKRWKYTSIPTDHYIQYKKKVFSVNDLNGKYEFYNPNPKVDGIDFTKKLVAKINVPIVEEAGLKTAYYAPRKDEIHIGKKEDYPSEREYYGDLLRQSIRSITKPGRINEKGTEGFAQNAADIKFVRDKFRVELATMQLAIKTNLPYTPTLTDDNIKRLSMNYSTYPTYLVMTAQDSYKLMNKAENLVLEKSKEQTISKEDFKEKIAANKPKKIESKEITLKDYVTKAVLDGKLSDRQIMNRALKGNFKELTEIKSDIKRRALVNSIKKEAQSKVESRAR